LLKGLQGDELCYIPDSQESAKPKLKSSNMNAILEHSTTTELNRPSPLDLTDEQLMAMLQQRDPVALEYLYDRHSAIVKSLGMKVVHNEAEAEDLLQEIFMEIWNRASGYDPAKGKPLGWIVTLARRRAIDRLRKCQSHCRAEDRLRDEVEQQPESWTTDPEEDFVMADIRETLRKLIRTLPEAQQQAIELAFYQGMSQREIAAHTGIPLGTIKTRLELGLKKMTVALKDFADEF
jgi:RNA polymerase sigma-70 factor (ECF subfamily)